MHELTVNSSPTIYAKNCNSVGPKSPLQTYWWDLIWQFSTESPYIQCTCIYGRKFWRHFDLAVGRKTATPPNFPAIKHRCTCLCLETKAFECG